MANQEPTSPLLQTSVQPEPKGPSFQPVPPWLKAVHGFTLAGVISGIFLAGVWKGTIESQIEEVRKTQERQLANFDRLSVQVNQLAQSLSYIQGLLERQDTATPRKTKYGASL